MFKHILLPTDGSELSDEAVQKGIEFAKAVNAKVTSIFVTQPYRVMLDDGFVVPSPAPTQAGYHEQAEQRARKVLGVVERLAAQAGVQCHSVHESSAAPYDSIIKSAERAGCDLIMMASHGRRGLQALLLGSETNKVLTHTKIPVLVCR